MAKIACLGAALQDLYLLDRTDFTSTHIDGTSLFRQIEIGNKLDVEHISHQVGGGGINAAVSLARFGHDVSLFATLAHDLGGEAVLSLLDRENIHNSYLSFTTDHHTGCSVILLDLQTGERTILTHRGAAQHFETLDTQRLSKIQPAWLYLTTTGGDFETLRKVCQQAQQSHCKIMFNPGVQELQQPHELLKLLSQVDILIVNKSEAQQIVHGELLPELLERLRRHVSTVIITAGVMGGVAGNEQDAWRFGAYPEARIVDTTGAGDAFGAGFLAHYATHDDFKQALVFAAANATSVMEQLGANTGALYRHQTLEHSIPMQRV